MEKSSGFAHIAVLLVILFVTIFGGISFLVINGYIELPIERKKLPPKNIGEEYTQLKQLEIKNAQVWDNDELLFINAHNVSEALVGPDGHTVHFKVPDSSRGAKCADLQSEIVQLPPNYPSPPPVEAPWDFNRINHAYTIGGCKEANQTGFIANGNIFAYIVIEEKDKGKLVILDLDKKERLELDLQEEVLDGFFSEDPKRVEDYWSTPISGNNGMYYIYPQDNTEEFNNKTILAFGRLLLGVDLKKKKLLGSVALTSPPYNVVANSFSFVENSNLPLAVVTSSWEGYVNLEALLDFDGETMKVINLNSYTEGHIDVFDIKDIAWKPDSVVLSFFEVERKDEDLTFYDMDEYSEKFIKEKQLEKERELEEVGEYEEVECFLTYGIYTGCYGAYNISRYEYSPGGSLRKI